MAKDLKDCEVLLFNRLSSGHRTVMTSDYVEEYESRFLPKEDNVAELFHANTRLCRYASSISREIMNGSFEEKLRRWYFNEVYDFNEEERKEREKQGLLVPLSEIKPPLPEEFVEKILASNALFSVDLLLLHRNLLLRFIPNKPYAMVEKKIDQIALKKLSRTTTEDLESFIAGEAEHGGIFFLVGVFWRLMLMYGPRGYRMVLLDAGKLAESLSRIHGRETSRTITSFYDDEVDTFLSLDGLERSCLALFFDRGGSSDG